MKEKLSSQLESSVFYFRKMLSNDTLLACRVELVPDHAARRCGFAFSLEMLEGGVYTTERAVSRSCGYFEAERIFDLICTENTPPNGLKEVIARALREGMK